MRNALTFGIVCLMTALLGNAARGDDLERFAKQLFRGARDNFTAPARRANHAPARTGVRTQSYVIRSADEWKLVARRYWCDDRLVPGRMPVVLCHGFGYNAEFFDLRPDTSLARVLAEQGFDVWAADLRGSGKSSKWALTTNGGAEALIGRFAGNVLRQMPEHGYVSLDPKYAKWNLDDHVNYDVPAILHLVKHHTGAAQIAWLGHSMGGNIMLAYLSRYGQDASVGRLVTVGSQLTMPRGQLVVEFMFEYLKHRQLEMAGQRPDPQQVLHNAKHLFFNERNADAGIVQALDTVGQDTPSAGVIKQYMDLGNSGKLRDTTKSVIYAAGLQNVKCPYLIIAGAADQIAPPDTQAYLHANVGASDRTLLILGRRTGFQVDYGHNDSLVSPAARHEVFPLIVRWLAGQSIANQ